jgi:periplasmic protein TonB
MLDQLVESKSNATENRRKSQFMLVTLGIAVVVVLGLWTRDLFAHDFGMGGDDMSLTTLVAPVPVPEEEPPPPEPEKKQEQQKQPDVDIRKELIATIDMSPKEPPKEISTVKLTVPPIRTDRLTMVGDRNSDTGARVEAGQARVVESGGTGGLSTGGGTAPTGGDDAGAPPPPPPAAKPTPKPVPKTVSGGVLNGKATSLPKPGYPPAAKAVHASGAVSVQVLISESGSVISASAVSGHPLLRAAAESAARGARFSPTLLSGQPVKVSGVITYNFVP